MRNYTLWRSAALLVALVAAAGIWRLGTPVASAQRGGASTCCCVASLDLNAVLGNLDERVARETELQGFIRSKEDELKKLDEKIKRLQDDLNILPENSPEWKGKREELLRANVGLRSERELSSALAEEMQTNMQLELFNKIRDAAARYAEQQSYAMVIVDDSEVEIPQPRSPDDFRQVEGAIVSRRVMFTAQCSDITEDVARMMNTEFAGQ